MLGIIAFENDCFRNGDEIQFWPMGNKRERFLAFEKEEKRWCLFSLELVLSDVGPVTAVAILGYWSEGDVLT